MTPEQHAHSLEELAEALGITRSYFDGTGTWRRASDDALLAVVRVLGAPLDRIEDAGEALRDLREGGQVSSQPRIITVVAGEGPTVSLPGFGPASPRPRPGHADLVLETGATMHVELESASDDSVRAAIPRETPAGYHRLVLETAGAPVEVAVFVAPARLPKAPRGWGLFSPLYGLRTRDRSPGGFATYGDLARLSSWMSARTNARPNETMNANRPASGGAREASYLGTLPLLACFFEDPFEPSPYSPISRAFWSELYVDPSASAEFASSDEAQRLVAQHDVAATPHHRATAASRDLTADTPRQREAATPPARTRLDYRAAMRARRLAMEALLRTLDANGPGSRRDHFETALEVDSELTSYAAFRAAVERHGSTWPNWSERARAGRLRAGVDYDGEAFRYHAYAQWLAREQVAAAANSSTAGFYLDLPLGSHGGGYDTWRHPGDFAVGVSAGAPPDAVFEGGQNWAFPPLHPEGARRSAYESVRAALRHHFEHAALLRVDHVMGLHRLFWIPDGFSAADGVYVRSHAGELWSILAIEASRARGGRGAAVVGEDLGTVPDEVRAEMNARGALRMHVIPFEGRDDPSSPVAPPPRDALSCLGTHDMEPFAAWWDSAGSSRDSIRHWLGCGDDTASVLAALLAWMAASDAAVVCASLEDLWFERERQNLPGTPSTHGNWQRPFALGFEEFTGDDSIRRLLDLLRGAAPSPHAGDSTEQDR